MEYFGTKLEKQHNNLTKNTTQENKSEGSC